MKAKQVLILALLALSTLNSAFSTAEAQGTAFTYQGQLSANSGPASGNYDFTFALFSTNSTNTGQVGATLTNLDVGVTNGLFVVTLDFGAGIFTGANYWLAIGVRTNGAANFTALNPLQELTPTPYAIYTPNAGSAATAISATSAATAATAGNVASGIVITNAVITNSVFEGNGGGLTNLSAAQLTGSAPTLTVGLLTISGALILPATTTSSDIITSGGNQLLYADNNYNFYSGFQAGSSDSTGPGNTANGDQALRDNSSGSYNTAVGQAALAANMSGSSNVAVGQGALGLLGYNTFEGGGSDNIALGYQAGYNYLNNESSNIVIGNLGSPGENNIIRIGSNQTTAHIAGVINGNGGGLTNLPSANLTGTLPALNGANLTNLSASQLTSIGNANPPAIGNFFVGLAGNATTLGQYNTVIGQGSLQANTTGNDNTAVGSAALQTNTTGMANTAFGFVALRYNSTGSENTAIGSGALSDLGNANNAGGTYNIALGYNAGSAYTRNESSNIVIGNIGSPGENNIIRIGSNQSTSYIAGVITGNGGGLTNLTAADLTGALPALNGANLTNVMGTLVQVVASGAGIAAQANTAYDLTNSAEVSVILPTNANVGDVIQVTGSGAGGWEIAEDSAVPWTEQTSGLPGSAYWQSVASSSDGAHLVAVVSAGGIYTSANSGANWTEQTSGLPGSALWQSVASSSDGTHLVAVVSAGGIYTSANSGANWTEQTSGLPGSALWQSVASSSDGTHLVAVVNAGGIYTSVNSGANWAEQTSGLPGSAYWQGVASSSDGTHLVAVALDGGIYTSVNSGANWAEQTSGLPGSAAWFSVASSSDGSHLMAVVYDGGIYTSVNSGVAWTEQTSGLPGSADWQGVASSSDGTHLVALAEGIYTSVNSGTNWTEQTGAPTSVFWASVTSSSDGAHLAAVVYEGGIYTTLEGMTGAAGTSEQFQYLGNGLWQPLPPTAGYLSSNGSTVLSLSTLVTSTLVTNGESGVTLSGTFSGNGSGLTNLTAANLTGAGTLPVAVLPASVALLTGNQTFTNVDTFSNGLTVATSAGTLALVNDGGVVPGITATGGLTPGHMRLRNGVEVWPDNAQANGGYLDVRNTNTTATITLTASSGTIVCSNITGNGAGLTSLTAANITPGGTLPSLNGANLTNLNASQLTSVGNSDDGSGNFFLGSGGNSTTSGSFNTAGGFNALAENTIGGENTAYGSGVLHFNTNGSDNTAYGYNALHSNLTGSNNTATGAGALSANTTGSNNIAIGFDAGANLSATSSNIDIGNLGSVGDQNTIRIGTNQTATYIAGISGATAASGVEVFVNSSGQLGTATSSARFKRDIQSMDDASDVLLSLHPVKFKYKPELDPQGLPQFGLVAEEVDKIDPDLVARDEKGNINTVRYNAVNAMLLNEFLKQHRKVQDQSEKLQSQDAEIQALQQKNDSLATRLNELEATVKLLADRK